MSDLKTYFAAPGRAEKPSGAEAADLAVRFPWFLPGRILCEGLTGESDPRVALMAPWRAESSLRRAAVDASALTQLSSEEIIERFLQEEDLRIVAGEGEPRRKSSCSPNWTTPTRWLPRNWPKSISLKAFVTSPWRFIVN